MTSQEIDQRPAAETKVKFASSVTFRDLVDTLEGRYVAVVVPNFYPKHLCKRIAERISKSIDGKPSKEPRIYDSEFGSFWSAVGNKERCKQYLAKSRSNLKRIRDTCHPYINPSDLLRLTLDEVWPCGANLNRYDQHPMVFGINRRWRESYEALPHHDKLQDEIPNDVNAMKIISQLGSNVYLETAERGGELEIWDYQVRSSEIDSWGVSGGYGFTRNRLPIHSELIKPEVGDLILLNATFVHAVRKIEKGERLTSSGFIGYWGEEFPLRMWS